MDKTEWQTRTENRRVLALTYFHHAMKNTVSLSAANSLAHELKKAEICYQLKKLGMEFYCEAEFANNTGRADIYITDIKTAIEVCETESEASILNKSQKYPCKVIPIMTGEAWNEKVLY